MKKIIAVISVALLVIIVVCSNGNKVKDERIIGTWEGVLGERYVFKENGTVEVLTEDNVRDFEAEDGKLTISYGKFGEDYYTYEIYFGTTDKETDTEPKYYMILKGNNTTTYLTKK